MRPKKSGGRQETGEAGGLRHLLILGLTSNRLGSPVGLGLAIGFFLTTGAAVAVAQDKPYPIFTLNHLDAAMKTLGPNVAGIRASLADGDFTTAKARVIRSREQLAITVTFWRDKGRDDAVALLRTALDRMDALDAALSIETVDPRAVETLATQIGDACTACHAVYREQDPVTREYRLTPGALTDR